MGVRNASVGNNTIVAAAPANGVETVIATTQPVNQPVDNAGILLGFFVVYTPGAAATSVTFRIRRGTTTTGTQINVTNALTATPAAVTDYSITYADLPGAVAGQQYSLTVTVAGGAAALAINDVSCAALAL